jgi:hypothetical protein
VENGTITQGPGAPPFSHGIRLGQGGGNRLTVHDVVFHVHSDSSVPVLTNFSGADARIYRNSFYNDVTTIQNRHQLQGMSVNFVNSQQARTGQEVYENKVVGGAQGGIFLSSTGSKAYNNHISQLASFTNDFGIYVWGNKQEVFGNAVTPERGRGIQLGGGGISVNGQGIGGKFSSVHDNNIKVVEGKVNVEYGGCELGGALGIQFDDNVQQGLAYRNTVVAVADECPAVGLKTTDVREGAGNTSRDNTYTAQRLRDTKAFAYGWNSETPTGFTSENDTFTADTANFHVDWMGASGLTCKKCTFAKGSNPAPNYATFAFSNGGDYPAKDLRFIDCSFENGASKDSFDMRPINAKNWPGPEEYYIDWTLNLKVTDRSARPLSGVTVTIVDSFSKEAFSGRTDSNGSVAAELTEFRRFNTTANVMKEMHTPHTVKLQKDGCATPEPIRISIDHTMNQTVQLDCR